VSHNFGTKRVGTNVTSWILLVISAAVLPCCLLIPFMDHSSQLRPTFMGPKISCTTSATLVTHNQCASWAQPGTLWPIAILLLLFLVLLGLAINFYASTLPHRSGRRFASYRLCVIIVASIIGFIAYVIMRGYSQNYDSGSYGLAPYAVSGTATLSIEGPYRLVSITRFGYGLTPLMVLLLIMGFLVPAVIYWHQFIYSRNYIDGQKKQDLFQ